MNATATTQKQQQQFFTRRTGSTKDPSQLLPFKYHLPLNQHHQQLNVHQYASQVSDIQSSFEQQQQQYGYQQHQQQQQFYGHHHLSNLSPLNSQIQRVINSDNSPVLQSHNLNTANYNANLMIMQNQMINANDYQRTNSFSYKNSQMQQYYHHQQNQQQQLHQQPTQSFYPQIYQQQHPLQIQQQSSNQQQQLQLLQKSDENSPLKQQKELAIIESNSRQGAAVQQQSQEQQQQIQPKIPVICGFHKRVLLLTSQVGAQQAQNQPGSIAVPNGANPNLLQTRRIRNKNPNCNHNSNFTFYQPSYNNVKYDDSYKKKEEVLRKVFFKECAKEEEKRSTLSAQQQLNSRQNGVNGALSTPGQSLPSKISINDPIQHLKIIENAICQTLFLDYEAQKNVNGSMNLQRNNQLLPISLMTELGLEQAIVAHKAFLLALIQAGKIINENMFKVLHEFKQSARDFDNECIYCKYSQYALRESAKISQNSSSVNGASSFVKSISNVASNDIPSEGVVAITADPLQQNQDGRIDNLVRMFQSQLFKRSFINTSLMIIQRKMNEKLLQKQRIGFPDRNNEKKKSQTANGQTKDQVGKKLSSNDPANPGQIKTQSQAPQSSLDQLSNQMQKLAKNLSNPKDKDKYLELKEKYYREFLNKINQSNGITINFPKTSIVPYKYYIGKGNNSLLVRNALKSRFWWSMGDFEEWEQYNFIWTQWKNNKILVQIKSNKDVQDQSQQDGTRSILTSAGGATGVSDSLMSTQMTVTDRDSNSSAETLLATPTRRKRASTLPQNQNQITQNNLAANQKKAASGGNNSNSISNSASKNANLKIQNVKDEIEKEVKQTSHSVITYSHMENNFHLSNKKAIYYNMKIYYESIGQDWWKVLPLTFHIKEGFNDKEFLKFQEIFKGNDNGQYGNLDKLGKTIWIVKPGENTNRGCGIQVCKELQQIKDIISNTNVNGQKRSYIIQKYIEKPLLYKNRKFDIRCYTLLTTVNGNLQGYWYSEGYLRTSSKDYNIKNVTNRMIHLTNDAVQKKSDDYGKFESGNKLSYADFQKYLDSINVKCNIVKEMEPQLKKIAQDTIKAVSRKLDPHRRHNTFEIFGYDFMIDEDLKPWLIEVNTNPCLELSAPYLARLIPTMIENAMKIAVDPLFPPPPWPPAKRHMIPDCTDNKFELVFNEATDSQELKNLPIDDTMNGIIEEEEMEDEGSDGDEEDLS